MSWSSAWAHGVMGEGYVSQIHAEEAFCGIEGQEGVCLRVNGSEVLLSQQEAVVVVALLSAFLVHMNCGAECSGG